MPTPSSPRRRSAIAPPVATQTPIAPLTDGLEFMQVLWALVHALERTSKRMAVEVGVTGPQRLVLRVVGLAPRLSAGELAATLHVHPSTLTGVLGRLVADGLITRIADAGDRRRAVLSLTPKGTRANAARRGTAEAAVTSALAVVKARDRATAIRILQRVTAHLAAGMDPDRR